MAANAIIKAEDLRVYYILPKGVYVKAVDGVNVEISEKGFTGIVGESGSGKTTLAESLLYLIEPPMIKMGGRVYYRDVDMEKIPKSERSRLYGEKLAIIPQYAMDALNPTLKIGGFIKDFAKSHKKDVEEIAKVAIERFRAIGLDEDVLNRYPHELSGGMRQRVTIVISSLLNPEVLIADEPTSNLDVVKQQVVLDFLEGLLRNGYVKTLVMVTHDLPLILERADRLIIMYGGHVVETGDKEEVLKEPLHPYTKLFIKSIPPVGARIKQSRLRGIPGNPPDLRFPPPGCRFHPRCPFAMDVCRKEVPPDIALGRGRVVKCWLYFGKR